MKRHPDQGCPGAKPRQAAHAGNGNSVDKLNSDYLQIRNAQAEAKLKLQQLKLGEQERRLLPVGYVQALLGDALVQLRQTMMLIPVRFRLRFRTIDVALAQQVNDWLRDDIDQALTKASEIQPALLSDDPWARWWFGEHVDDKKSVEKAKRTQKRHAKARR